MQASQLEGEERLLAGVVSRRGWLWLPPELLTRFRAGRNAADLRASWVAVVCAILVLDSFVFTDTHLVPDVSYLTVHVRLLLLTPLAFAYVPLSRWLVRRNPSTLGHHVYVAFFANAVVAWVGLVQAQTRAETGSVYFTGAYLVLVFYAAAMRGPMLVRVPAVVVMLAVFMGSMSVVTVVPVAQRVDAALCMVGFSAFCLLGSHREEHAARQRVILGGQARLLEVRRELLLDELAAANEQLTHQATRDAVTGVPNRRAVDSAMARWADGEPVAGALLVIDLDHFKAYNDAFGHQGGDAVLRKVAQVMSATLRGEDVMLARYGGEEFVAILRGVTPAAARRAAERLRAAVEAQHICVPDSLWIQGRQHVTVSVGGAWTSSSQLSSAQDLLGVADTALYEAKAAGRNTVRFGEMVEGRACDLSRVCQPALPPSSG